MPLSTPLVWIHDAAMREEPTSSSISASRVWLISCVQYKGAAAATVVPLPHLFISTGVLHMVLICLLLNSVFASCMVFMSALVSWSAYMSMLALSTSSLLALSLKDPTLCDLSQMCSFIVPFGMALWLRPFGALLPCPGLSASPILTPVYPSVHSMRIRGMVRVGFSFFFTGRMRGC